MLREELTGTAQWLVPLLVFVIAYHAETTLRKVLERKPERGKIECTGARHGIVELARMAIPRGNFFQIGLG